MRVLFSPRSRIDLLEIGDYIAQDNRKRAASFLEEIEMQCQKLAEHPFRGRSRPEVSERLRSIAFGSYVIFYSSDDKDVRIERILHGARDLNRIFKSM